MTSSHELTWTHAVDNGDFDIADETAAKHSQESDQALPEQKIASGTSQQRAILASAAYWGVDYGSLPFGRMEP
ncbi:hypothetical protein I8H89_04120 [Candidatus Saccharibacteria bacterium]|nr:hypothetical protein [Candidatus Saccharibacteria bacterium]